MILRAIVSIGNSVFGIENRIPYTSAFHTVHRTGNKGPVQVVVVQLVSDAQSSEVYSGYYRMRGIMQLVTEFVSENYEFSPKSIVVVSAVNDTVYTDPDAESDSESDAEPALVSSKDRTSQKVIMTQVLKMLKAGVLPEDLEPFLSGTGIMLTYGT